MNNSISRIDFQDNDYIVKQKAVRNAYKVYDSSENVVLKTKQKMFKMKEEFPFTDPEGNEVFTVKAKKIMDIAGDYALIDSGTGKTIAVLEKEFSILTHRWKIQDPQNNLIAEIESRGKFMGLVRGIHEFFELLPHKYTITNSEGESLGTIEQSFTLLRDKYEVKIEEGVENKESIIAAAITIDALEGN